MNVFLTIRRTMFARLALPLARPVPQGAHLAFNVVAGSVDAQLEHMVHQHASFQAPVDAANAYYRRVVRNADLSTLDQEVGLPVSLHLDTITRATKAYRFSRNPRNSWH